MSKELLLTSSNHTLNWSACLWDYSTGNSLHVYKNGDAIGPKTLALVGQDYTIGADSNRPIIHAWALNSQEPQKKSTWILPGIVKTLAVCPQKTFLAVGIENKVYLWHLSSGKLFNLIKKNYQDVVCVKFSNCGTYLCVGGEEGLLLTYKVVQLVSFSSNYLSGIEGVEPAYNKNDHSSAITDLIVGAFGAKSRLITTSLDCTAKIYELSSGELLLNLITFNIPTAIISDNCWRLFLGFDNGNIQELNLIDPPRTLDHHLNNENTYYGHQKKITCLDFSLYANNLASGSEDFHVFIWDIYSRQIIRKIPHKESITNVKFVLNYENFFTTSLKPKVILCKSLDKELRSENSFIVSLNQDYDIDLSDCEEETKAASDDLQAENLKLRCINKQLFEVALDISRKYNFE